MSNRVRLARYVVTDLKVSLVFLTKDDMLEFSSLEQEVLKDSFLSVCDKFDATLDDLAVESAKVTLTLTYPAKVSVSSLVNSLKGVSSRMLKKDKAFNDRLLGEALWSASYFAVSNAGNIDTPNPSQCS